MWQCTDEQYLFCVISSRHPSQQLPRKRNERSSDVASTHASRQHAAPSTKALGSGCIGCFKVLDVLSSHAVTDAACQSAQAPPYRILYCTSWPWYIGIPEKITRTYIYGLSCIRMLNSLRRGFHSYHPAVRLRKVMLTVRAEWEPTSAPLSSTRYQ